MQGVRYPIVLDSLTHNFVTGEIEHVIHQVFVSERSDVVILEGQGGITHPARLGGLELVAAGRPDAIVLQHAPERGFYYDLTQYPISSLEREVQILELLSQKQLIALTLNHEGISDEGSDETIKNYEAIYSRPATDVLKFGCERLVQEIEGIFSDRLRSVARG